MVVKDVIEVDVLSDSCSATQIWMVVKEENSVNSTDCSNFMVWIVIFVRFGYILWWKNDN